MSDKMSRILANGSLILWSAASTREEIRLCIEKLSPRSRIIPMLCPMRKYRAAIRSNRLLPNLRKVNSYEIITHYAWKGKKWAIWNRTIFVDTQLRKNFFACCDGNWTGEKRDISRRAELPDPPPEFIQRMQAHLQGNMRKAQNREHRCAIFLNFKSLFACAAIVYYLLISGIYFIVDATRNSVNNFVLEVDTHTTIKSGGFSPAGGALLPVNREGSFKINWVPVHFTHVQGFSFDYMATSIF